MSLIVLKDASVTINSVDLSNHVREVQIKYSAEIIDKTTMGATGKGKVSGLVDASIDIEFAQDYAAGSVDATLFPLVGGAAVPIVIKPKSGAVAVDNPSYSGSAIVSDYPPLAGKVGELATVKAHLEVDGVLTRATA